jgi:hypothetical protein
VLAAEHRLYPLALGLVAAGRVRVVEERTIIDAPDAPRDAPGGLLLNPPG